LDQNDINEIKITFKSKIRNYNKDEIINIEKLQVKPKQNKLLFKKINNEPIKIYSNLNFYKEDFDDNKCSLFTNQN